MIKYLRGEKNVRLLKKKKKGEKAPFHLFTAKMVKIGVFLGKVSAKWDFIIGARPEQRERNNK